MALYGRPKLECQTISLQFWWIRRLCKVSRGETHCKSLDSIDAHKPRSDEDIKWKEIGMLC